jgi:hypothetical protein
MLAERINSTLPGAEVLFVPIEYANITSLLPKLPITLPFTVETDNAAFVCATVNGVIEYPFQFI